MAYQWRFGTSGIRALMGAGEDRLNTESIARIARATAAALRQEHPEGGAVVVCHDSRANSAAFARTATQALKAGGFTVYHGREPAPTPFLSFAVRRLGAIAGINLTASHNPPQYNGFKLYGADGAASGDSLNRRVERLLGETKAPQPVSPAAVERDIPAAVETDYLRLLMGYTGIADADFTGLQAVYTPLGGTGGRLMRRLTQLARLPLCFVAEEMGPDGALAGIAHPAPDTPAAFRRAVELGGTCGAQLLLATDPDADRFGLMLREKDGYRLLSGNQIGLVLLQYLIERGQARGEALNGMWVAKSLVTTPLAERICLAHGLELHHTAVGFRHIGRLIGEHAAGFLFGFEESGGYLATTQVRDKDGLAAACLLLSAAAFYQRRGLSLGQALAGIYRQYGACAELSHSVDCPHGQAALIMDALRRRPPARLGGIGIVSIRDYLRADNALDADILRFDLAGGRVLYLRPSGTEHKLKAYIFAGGPAGCAQAWQAAARELQARGFKPGAGS